MYIPLIFSSSFASTFFSSVTVLNQLPWRMRSGEISTFLPVTEIKCQLSLHMTTFLSLTLWGAFYDFFR